MSVMSDPKNPAELYARNDSVPTGHLKTDIALQRGEREIIKPAPPRDKPAVSSDTNSEGQRGDALGSGVGQRR